MRLGVSSFTFPWAIGGIDNDYPISMTAFELLEKANALGAEVLQIADNLPIGHLSNEELGQLRTMADSFGIALEVGTRGISTTNIARFLEIAAILGSPILRIVIDTKEHLVMTGLESVWTLLTPWAQSKRQIQLFQHLLHERSMFI